MATSAVHALINSIDIHWSRLDDHKRRNSKDGISSRILKVLYDRKVRYDIVVSTMDNLLEFFKQNSTVKNELIESGIFNAMVFQLEASMDIASVKSTARVLKGCLDILKLEEVQSSSCLPLKEFLNAGLVSAIMRAVRICNNDASVMKYIGFLLRHLAEKGIVMSGASSQDALVFLQHIAVHLLRHPASVTTTFNYSRSIVIMHNTRLQMRHFVSSALVAAVDALRGNESIRQRAETCRIVCVLLLFYTWEDLNKAQQGSDTSRKSPTTKDISFVMDCLVAHLTRSSKDAVAIVQVCLALRTALRPFVGNKSDTSFSSSLQRHLLLDSTLPDTLLSILTHHRNNYRVVVVALECLFCLVSPYRTCSDSSTYHIVTSTQCRPVEVTRSSGGGAYELDHIADERCADLLGQWWAYVVRAIYNARWRRRKAFCLFLVCCCDQSCVYKDSVMAHGDAFPSLSLLYSSICPLVACSSAVDKVFFSMKLCTAIMSFL